MNVYEINMLGFELKLRLEYQYHTMQKKKNLKRTIFTYIKFNTKRCPCHNAVFNILGKHWYETEA